MIYELFILNFFHNTQTVSELSRLRYARCLKKWTVLMLSCIHDLACKLECLGLN